MKLSNFWTADFETTSDNNGARVWAFSVSNIENPEIFQYGTSMEEFFEWIELHDKENLKMYFHNLKYDGFYIISYLMKQGYAWIESPKERKDKTFATLISDMGQYYSITVFFKIQGHHTRKVTFYDSMKIFPNFSVEKVAEGFNLPLRKLEIDYDKYRPIGYQPDQQEIDYIRNDVEIMSRALKIMFEQGHTKMTIASDAMKDYKARIKGFRHKFPLLREEVDADIRKSYRGGFTWVNDVWKGKDVGKGITLDVNSLYPSVMKFNVLPYSEPVFYAGKYEDDPVYPLYVQALTCSFDIKPGKIPSIQLKNNLSFIPNEYVKSSNGEYVDLVLTKPDMELFLEQYDVNVKVYSGGWKFRGATGLFDCYIDHWIEQKIKAGKEGNAPIRQISKLLLNSLYGRFGISGESKQKAPYLDSDGVVRFTIIEQEPRKTCYIPIACFVTAYGRAKIIRAFQAVRDYTLKKYGEDRAFYGDTDSLHGNLSPEDLEELKDVIQIDDYKLGFFAQEASYSKARYIRQKCYIELVDGKTEVTVAGLPKYLAPLINFENFKKGFTTAGMTKEDMDNLARANGTSEEEIKKIHHKLTYKYVNGGVLLADTDFTIK